MFSVKEYNKRLQVGDLIWYQKDNPEAYGGEDIGYIREIIKINDVNRYVIFWLKPENNNITRETQKSIKEMHESYIIPICKK